MKELQTRACEDVLHGDDGLAEEMASKWASYSEATRQTLLWLLDWTESTAVRKSGAARGERSETARSSHALTPLLSLSPSLSLCLPRTADERRADSPPPPRRRHARTHDLHLLRSAACVRVRRAETHALARHCAQTADAHGRVSARAPARDGPQLCDARRLVQRVVQCVFVASR